MDKTVKVADETHSRLEERKVVDRETFNGVIERLLDETETDDANG